MFNIAMREQSGRTQVQGGLSSALIQPSLCQQDFVELCIIRLICVSRSLLHLLTIDDAGVMVKYVVSGDELDCPCSILSKCSLFQHENSSLL